jgi:hypothetical protein
LQKWEKAPLTVDKDHKKHKILQLKRKIEKWRKRYLKIQPRSILIDERNRVGKQSCKTVIKSQMQQIEEEKQADMQ